MWAGLDMVPKTGEVLRAEKTGSARWGDERLRRRCLESGASTWQYSLSMRCWRSPFRWVLVRPVLPLIPGVGLEERFGCWRTVGVGVVAVVVFGFGAAEGVVFERGLFAGA